MLSLKTETFTMEKDDDRFVFSCVVRSTSSLLERVSDTDRMDIINDLFNKLSLDGQTEMLNRLREKAVMEIDTEYHYLVIGGPFKDAITDVTAQLPYFQHDIAMQLGDDRRIVYVDGSKNECTSLMIANFHEIYFEEHPRRKEIQDQMRKLGLAGICCDLESRLANIVWTDDHVDPIDTVSDYLDALTGVFSRDPNPVKNALALGASLQEMSRGLRIQKMFNITVAGKFKRCLYVEPLAVE